MIKEILLTIFVFFLGILQHTFFSHFEIKNAFLNLVVLFFLTISFLDKKIASSFFIYPFAFFGGMILDLFSPFSFGIYTAMMLFLAIFLRYISQLIVKKNFAIFFIVLLASLFLIEFFKTFIGLIFYNHFFFSWWTIIYNSILGIGFYFIYVFFKKLKLHKKSKR